MSANNDASVLIPYVKEIPALPCVLSTLDVLDVTVWIGIENKKLIMKIEPKGMWAIMDKQAAQMLVSRLNAAIVNMDYYGD